MFPFIRSSGPLTIPRGLVECELGELGGLDELDGLDERVYCWAGRRGVCCDGVTVRRGACRMRVGGGRVRHGVCARDAVASNRSTVA